MGVWPNEWPNDSRLSQAGVHGDPATRITSWRKASLRTHVASGLVFESERPIAEIARDLGVHPEALRKRVLQLEADTGRRSDLLESNTRPVEARGFGARPATQPC
jgi:hypothetical protein